MTDAPEEPARRCPICESSMRLRKFKPCGTEPIWHCDSCGYTEPLSTENADAIEQMMSGMTIYMCANCEVEMVPVKEVGGDRLFWCCPICGGVDRIGEVGG